MFRFGNFCSEFKCPLSNIEQRMTPKSKKSSKSSSTSSWSCLAMPNTIIPSKMRSSSPKSPQSKYASLTNLRMAIPTNGHATPPCDCTCLRNGNTNSYHDEDDLMQAVIQMRVQLEALKGALEEQARIDAEKDRVIERLTMALENCRMHGLNGHNSPSSVSAAGHGKHRQRSVSGGSPVHQIDHNRFAELRLTPGEFEGDLV